MSIKTNAEQIRDESATGANTATRVGGNLVEIADDLIAKQTEIDDNTVKVGITTSQASDIQTNNSKIGISTGQASAIVLNTAKVGFTDALVNANANVTSNTAKVGITTGQASAIVTNSAKVSFDSTSSTRLANTSGTNTGDLLNGVSVLSISPINAVSVWVGSQSQYDALVTKVTTVIYNIV